MKVVAYYAVHYGREWMNWSMRSIANVVDNILVFYTPKPSYGYTTNNPCPESKEQLMRIASTHNVTWFDIPPQISNEGKHRDYAVDVCKNDFGADVVLPIDCDELWEEYHLQEVLRQIVDGELKARNIRVPMQHFYRSVKWVCRDPLQPVRAIDLAYENGDAYISHRYGYMHHFGYAQSPRIVKYKWEIHGHAAELRQGWFENKFMNWQPVMMDVHPTNENFWNPASFTKEDIAHLISDHPYYNMDIIDNSVVDGVYEQTKKISRGFVS